MDSNTYLNIERYFKFTLLSFLAVGLFTACGSDASIDESGPVDTEETTVIVSSGSVIADGQDEGLVIVAVRDANGNLVTDAVVTLAEDSTSAKVSSEALLATSTDSTISEVVNNNDGTYTFTVTNTKAETVTYTVTVDGVVVDDKVSVLFTPGDINAETSSFSASPSEVVADGVEASTLTLTLRDENNNLISDASDIVVTQGGSSDLGTVTNNNDGSYTLTATSIVAEVETYAAVADTVVITQVANVTFVPDVVDADESNVTATLTSLVANGSSESNITVTVKDANANLISDANVSLAQTGTSSIDTVINNGDGTYTFVVRSIVAEAVTYTATADGTGITQTADVTFTADAVNAGTSTVTASPSSITADGTTTSTITVTARDINNNTISGLAVSLGQGVGSSSISANGNTNASGVYTYTVSSTKAETVTYTATVDGTGISQTADVTFVPNAVNAGTSSVTASPSSITADGTTTSTITVTARDVSNNLISGLAVVLGQGAGSSTISGDGNTNASGVYTYTVTSTTAEAVTYTATVDGTGISQTADVTFAAGAADESTSTVAVTNDNATADNSDAITVTATILDANSNPVDGETVSFAATIGVSFNSSTCTTDSSGTCVVTATSSIASNYSTAVTISAGTLSNSPATYSFVAGAVSATQSTVSQSPNSITADGTATSTITVTARDINNNLISGAAVVLGQGAGSSSISGNGNTNASGVFTYTVSSTKAETVTYTATVDGTGISQTADVTFTADAADESTSTVAVTNDNAIADGSDAVTLTATILDVNSNPVNGETVTFAATSGVMSTPLSFPTYLSILGGVSAPALLPSAPLATCVTNTSGVCSIAVYSALINTYSTASTVVSITAGILSNSPASYTFIPTPLPANIVLSGGVVHYAASVYDDDYLPYQDAMSAATTDSEAADASTETLMEINGTLDSTGITVFIPYEVTGSDVNLSAYTQTVTVAAELTEDSAATDIVFSYSAQTLVVGTGRIAATIAAVSTTLNIKKLDLNTGIGDGSDTILVDSGTNEELNVYGVLLANFSIAINDTSGDIADVQFRSMPGIADRMFGLADNNGDTDSHMFLYMPVKNTDTNETWLNNNLGANYANVTKTALFNPMQQATANLDYDAFGSHFQWGRKADGHELLAWAGAVSMTRVHGTDATKADNPTHPDFITTATAEDWRVNSDAGLWDGSTAVNTVCPSGYAVPVDSELSSEFNSWNPQNAAGAISGEVKLSLAAYSSYLDGDYVSISTDYGLYWTASTSADTSSIRHFNDSGIFNTNSQRSLGHSVRCIKD